MYDIGLDGHDRLDGQLVHIHFIGRIAAVEDDAWAACIEMYRRQFHDGSTVGQGLPWNFHTGSRQRVVEFIVLGFLLVGVSLIEGVCRGHVGEQAANLEILQGGNLLYIFHCSIDVGIIRQIADSAHTGIYSNQASYGLACSGSGSIDGSGIGCIADNRRDVIVHDGIRIHIRGQSQHDDFFSGAGFPQGDGFLEGGDGKNLHTVFPEHFCNLNASVTIGVGFDDTDHIPVADFGADIFNVVIQIG